MQVQPIKTRIFQEGESLYNFIVEHLEQLSENSVLVVTSKIVALAENRTAKILSPQTKVDLIRQESDLAIETKYVWLTVKDGAVMASAGIDESNANGKLILLPKNSFESAEKLRQSLQEKYQIKNLGVLITDSRTMPLRLGVTGVALGYAGFKGIKDYRNQPDIYDRKFHFAQVNVADSLAAAAVLTMGEGAEQQPLALIQVVPVEFCEVVDDSELRIDINDDMYQPLFLGIQEK